MKKTILAIAVIILSAVAPAAEKKGLKVYVSVDMEGISGIVHGDQVSAGTAEYPAARKWMAADANAVIAGLIAAGATEILVNDAHGTMRNLSPDDLRPEAALISGTPKPLSMMEGIDGSFDACVFVGYHGRAGTHSAILDHTISGGVIYAVRVNGREMPELGLNALIAGHYGVPVAMVSGDADACEQAGSIIGGGVVTVAVKEAIGRNAARLLPMAEARRRLEEGAKTALLARERFRPYRLDPPYRFQAVFMNSGQAEAGEMLPMVKRMDARTLEFSSRDYLEGFKILRALISLASTR